MSRIKSITRVSSFSSRYDLTVDNFHCYVANGIVVHNTDATNLMISWKDNRIIAARSKNHLKNQGKDALSIAEIESKFKGRPLEFAYGQAMRDMNSALLNLSSAQRTKIFDEGRKWMSIEVMMPESSENIIKYGVTELRLHGIMTYDDAGEPTKQIDKEAARMLDGMLRQVNAHIQERFHIRRLSQVKLPSINSFNQKKAQYIGELKQIMNKLEVKDSDTIITARKKYFTKELDALKVSIDDTTKKSLLNRWALNDKSIGIVSLLKPLPAETKDKIKILDKAIESHTKDIVRPLEFLFLKLGADVLTLMTDFMALNPDKAVQKIKADLDDTIIMVKKSGDPKLMDKLKYELDRLDAIGGMKKIIPSEGITFFYKGELLKITGVFAPINQVLGLRFKL